MCEGGMGQSRAKTQLKRANRRVGIRGFATPTSSQAGRQRGSRLGTASSPPQGPGKKGSLSVRGVCVAAGRTVRWASIVGLMEKSQSRQFQFLQK